MICVVVVDGYEESLNGVSESNFVLLQLVSIRCCYSCRFLCCFTHYWSTGWCCGALLCCEEEIQMSQVLLSDNSPQAAEATAPRSGSLENYTDTTEGSVVFYRCGPGLVPQQQMRAVCTENGWSPNPADLDCFAGMLHTNV